MVVEAVATDEEKAAAKIEHLDGTMWWAASFLVNRAPYPEARMCSWLASGKLSFLLGAVSPKSRGCRAAILVSFFNPSPQNIFDGTHSLQGCRLQTQPRCGLKPRIGSDVDTSFLTSMHIHHSIEDTANILRASSGYRWQSPTLTDQLARELRPQRRPPSEVPSAQYWCAVDVI